MTAKPSQLLRIYYQRQFRWTKLGNGWVFLRPLMRVAPFFLFGLTHVSDDSPITVLLVNLGVWSMLEATYRCGVLSWRYFEKEEFLVSQRSLWTLYFFVGAIEAGTVIPLVVLAALVEGSSAQLFRSLVALPILVLVFTPLAIALGEVSRHVSTKLWDLKFIGGYVISSLVFTAPILRPFQSSWGTQILVWNPIGFPFLVGRSFIVSGQVSAPVQASVSYSVLISVMLLIVLGRSTSRGYRRSALRRVQGQDVFVAQPQVDYPLDGDLEPIETVLPVHNEARFQVSDRDTGTDLIRLVVGESESGRLYRDKDVGVRLDVYNHSVIHSVYPRLHVHKHDGKHIFSLIWPDGPGLLMSQGRITQISTNIPKCMLGAGVYFVSVDICAYDPFKRILTSPLVARFEIEEIGSELPDNQRSPHDRKGYFQPESEWQSRSMTIDGYSALISTEEMKGRDFSTVQGAATGGKGEK